jgi:hypothetical protein
MPAQMRAHVFARMGRSTMRRLKVLSFSLRSFESRGVRDQAAPAQMGGAGEIHGSSPRGEARTLTSRIERSPFRAPAVAAA